LSIKGIDISCFQTVTDWQAVKNSGIEFVMVRDGFGNDISQMDSKFESHVQGALSVGLHIGIYHFSYATSVADAIKEAKVCKQIITKYSGKIDYPIAFDFEGDSYKNFIKVNGRAPTKQEITDITNAFCDEMKKGNWYPVNYTNCDYIRNKLNLSQIKCDLWLAYYQNGTAYNCKMQQYASDGKVNGITGNVDMDYSYIDYSWIVKNAHLNGYVCTNSVPTPTAQTNKPSPSPIKKPTIPVSTIVTPKTEDSIAITTDKLNIRDAMNMTSNIMMTLEKGHQVQIINYPNLVWAQVKPKGSNRIGYCVKQYLQVVHNVNVNFSLDTTSKDMKITDPAYNLLAKNVKPIDIKIDVVGKDKISVSAPYIDPKGRGTMIDIKGLCKGFAHVTVMYKNKTAQCNFNVK